MAPGSWRSLAPALEGSADSGSGGRRRSSESFASRSLASSGAFAEGGEAARASAVAVSVTETPIATIAAPRTSRRRRVLELGDVLMRCIRPVRGDAVKCRPTRPSRYGGVPPPDRGRQRQTEAEEEGERMHRMFAGMNRRVESRLSRLGASSPLFWVARDGIPGAGPWGA